jgi:carboxypeptidase C (cathepsin A)
MRIPMIYRVCAVIVALPICTVHAISYGAERASTCVTESAGEHECKSYHSATLNGRTLSYEANAGTLITRDAAGHPQQSIFFVAYVLHDGHSGESRPITFLFNGGPGASSVFLHMASFGPLRIQTAATSFLPPAPYTLAPNPDTLLGTTDLVFIDAPNSGYSRALGSSKASDYYSTDGDTSVFASAIERYLTKYDRWNSPKFLFGESYGTTRAAAVAYRLESQDVAVNGVILLSSALNLWRFFGSSDLDLEYVSQIPSFAAVAWYHKRVSAAKSQRLADFVEQARAFAMGPYALALSKGQNIDSVEFDRVAEQLVRFTGLPLDYIRRVKLRITPSGFEQQLLRDEGETLGMLDGRFAASEGDANEGTPLFDPSYVASSHAIYGEAVQYLTDTLGYHTDLRYNIAAQWGGPLNWNFAHTAPDGQKQQVADVSFDLAAAMRTNPYLQVLSLNGLYDLTTPFFGTEIDLSHMMLDAEARNRLTIKFYQSGHMAYIDLAALHMMRGDIGTFIESACAQSEALAKAEH